LQLWHLCSLDAPSVAVLWTWFIAHAAGVVLPPASLAAMGMAVWILYAADRLLDARLLEASPLHFGNAELEARHFFHHRHRAAFLTGIVAASIALTPLLLRIPPAAIQLYLIEGSLLFGWFLLIHVIHATRSNFRLPKELAVGCFFAAAVFIPTVSRAPWLRFRLLIPALLFAALCSLNCLYIYAWEHDAGSDQKPRPHPTTRFARQHLAELACGLCVASFCFAFSSVAPRAVRPLATACALSVIFLLLLHRNRRCFDRTTLRAAADLALLTPLLLFPR
jgi:hypothetical protein